MTDLSIVIDYYRLLSEKASWYYAVLLIEDQQNRHYSQENQQLGACPNV